MLTLEFLKLKTIHRFNPTLFSLHASLSLLPVFIHHDSIYNQYFLNRRSSLLFSSKLPIDNCRVPIFHRSKFNQTDLYPLLPTDTNASLLQYFFFLCSDSGSCAYGGPQPQNKNSCRSGSFTVQTHTLHRIQVRIWFLHHNIFKWQMTISSEGINNLHIYTQEKDFPLWRWLEHSLSTLRRIFSKGWWSVLGFSPSSQLLHLYFHFRPLK